MKHTINLIILLFALCCSLAACNSKVFVDEEPSSSSTFSIACGDSLTVSVNKNNFHGASICTDVPSTLIAVYKSGQVLNVDLDSYMYFDIDELSRISYFELRQGLGCATLTPDLSSGSFKVSSASNLSASANSFTLEIFYEYTEQTYSFTLLPFKGTIRVVDVEYTGTVSEHDAPEHSVTLSFDNPSDEQKSFSWQPFLNQTRNLTFAIDKAYVNAPIDYSDLPMVEVPSFPPPHMSGSVGLYGVKEQLAFGTASLPSLMQDRTFKVFVDPHTRREITVTLVPSLLKADLNFVCVNPSSPHALIRIPGTVSVEYDDFYRSSSNITLLP